MNIFLGGNPLNQKEDTTPIYTSPCSIPPLSDYESFPAIKKANVAEFIEHLYFITMERNGLSYFYPNLETGENLCRFEWHYELLDNPYELRLGLSFKVNNSIITEVGYYFVPHEHYEDSSKREEYLIEDIETDKITEYIKDSVKKALLRIEHNEKNTYYSLYYIELSNPVLNIIEITKEFKILPSRLINGTLISAVVIETIGHSHLSVQRFADEKINLMCALISLIINTAKLAHIKNFPSCISSPNKGFQYSDENIEKLYPDTKSDLPGINKYIEDDDIKFIIKTFMLLDTNERVKAKRKIKNIVFSYYSAKETETINRTVSLVSYVACLDAIAKEYCPEVRNKDGSRKALAQLIIQLLEMSDQKEGIDKWSKRIYNEHRSSYMHGANIRFEEFSQNMDGNNFAGLPKALPRGAEPVTKQYKYESDYRILKKVSLSVLIKYIEIISGIHLDKPDLNDKIDFSGDSPAEAYVGLVNKGWVKCT